MKKKKGIFILLIVVLSLAGVAVAYWSGNIGIGSTAHMAGMTLAFDNSEPPVCTEFHEAGGVLVQGEIDGENVGETTCWYQGGITDPRTENWGYENMIITINNAYPGYRVHVTFTVHNIGSIPVDICGFVVTDPMGVLMWDNNQGALVDDNDKPIINIYHVDFVGERIGPCTKVRSEFGFLIMHDAQEGYTYSSEIAIVYSQWGQTMASTQVPPPTNINIVVDNDWENDDQVEASVGGNFTWGANAFAKIQDAIGKASPNDNILVYPGTYNENINIDKSLTVRSAEGAGVTIINAQEAQFGVLINGAETVATFDGFTVDDYDTVGILAGAFDTELEGVDLGDDPVEVHILNNIVKQPTIPSSHSNNIQVEDGPKGTVIGNEVIGASLENPNLKGSGIRVASSSNVLVSNNYAHDCELGILIVGYAECLGGKSAENNRIENNSVENNGCGIIVKGMTIDAIIRYNDVSNNDVGIESVAFDVGGWPEHSTPLGTKVHHNNIVGNKDYGVESSVWFWGGNGKVLAEQIDATLNWWGDNSGPYHPDTNPDGLGDNVSDNVDYTSWLNAPYPTG